jgi:hypothetical protein
MGGDCLLALGRPRAFNRRDRRGNPEFAEKTESQAHVANCAVKILFAYSAPISAFSAVKSFLLPGARRAAKLELVGQFQRRCDAVAKFVFDRDQAQDKITITWKIIKMTGMDEHPRAPQ